MELIMQLKGWLHAVASWSLLDIGWRSAGLFLTWGVVWVLVRHFHKVLERIQREGRHFAPRDIKTVDRLLDYLFIAVGIIITLSLLGLSELLYSALTAAGIVGIMIGFAVKDVAANFVSGIFMMFDRHFAVGDAIKIGEYVGTVKEIALRTTTIATFDGPIVTIPNSHMATTPIINYSITTERRIDMTVSVVIESDIAHAEALIRQFIEADERFSKDSEPLIYVSGLENRAATIQVFCYVQISDLLAAQSDLRKGVIERFRQAGIVLAAPIVMTLTPQHIFPGAKG